MNSTMKQASSAERMFAALAQLGILLPGFGLLVPLQIWLNNRDWSDCVQFHALQALVWHLVSSSILTMYYVLFYLGGLGALISAQGGLALSPGLVTLRCLVILAGVAGYGVLAFMGIRAARHILAGINHVYPIIGDWLAHYL